MTSEVCTSFGLTSIGSKMISKFNKILVLLLAIAATLYVVIMNGGDAHLTLTPTTKFSARSGVLYLGVFIAGALAAGLIAAVFGFKAYLRERKFQNQEKQRQKFYGAYLQARSLLASEEWDKAREQWEKLVKKDPTDTIARVELSRSLEGAGKTREALKILDAARSANPDNIEVLFRAAELNQTLKNKTGAVDNLALILYHHPNIRAARRARDLSEEIGRVEDALEYQEKLEKLGDSSDSEEARVRLDFKKLCKDLEETDAEAFEKSLRKFVKKTTHVPALHRLSLLEKKDGKIEEAAQLLVQAARLTGTSDYWREATHLWIKNDMPERAVAAARTATKDTKGTARIHAELDLIRVYLAVGKVEESKNLIDSFAALAKEVGVDLNEEASQQLLILKGLCLNRLGDFRGAAEIWKKLSLYEYDIVESKLKSQLALNGKAPEPRLSTP